MTIRKELLEALGKELGGDPYRRSDQLQIHECENIALWAAKWIAEKDAQLMVNTGKLNAAQDIRDQAKELK